MATIISEDTTTLADIANALIIACTGVTGFPGIDPAEKHTAVSSYGQLVIESSQVTAEARWRSVKATGN